MRKVWISCIVTAVLLALFWILPCSASAESFTSVSVTGTCDYPEAYKVLELVNRERAAYGLPPLTLDASLTELAMFRAAECAIYYPTDSNHTRPNGKPCNTAPGYPTYYWSENVAAGQHDAEAVMTAWMNSTGHRTNILKTTRTSIGIGAFYHCGKYYWAQVFSAAAGNPPSYRAAEERSFTVEVSDAYFSLYTTEFSMKQGETRQIGLAGENKGWSWFGFSLNRDFFSFSSSNTTVATVNSQGVVTAKNKGAATIYLSPKNGASAIPISVTVYGVPKITKDLASVCVKNGQRATVTISATGDGLQYTWYRKDVGEEYFTCIGTYVDGNAYSVTMSDACAKRQVYCVITDQYGTRVTSKTATLYQPVKITKQPSNGLAYSGTTAKVTVKAAGAGLTYRWYVKNPGSDKYVYTSSVKGNTYSVTMNKDRAGRRVLCWVYDKFGNKVQSKSAVLDYKVKITKQPANVCKTNGKTAKVTVKATGSGLKYRWYAKSPGSSKYVYTSSFKGSSYYVTMNNTRAGRQVYCVITDKYGNKVQSKSVSLDKPVAITKQPKNAIVSVGNQATITVKASGGGLTYRWYAKNPGSSKYVYTSSFKGNTYRVTMNGSRAGRRVYCRIYDRYGNSVQTKSVVLDQKVHITQQPDWVATASFGKIAKATVKAKGSGLTYRWYYKNAWDKSYRYTSTFKGNSYSVKMDTSKIGRRVYCVITDKYGNTVKSREVYLRMP